MRPHQTNLEAFVKLGAFLNAFCQGSDPDKKWPVHWNELLSETISTAGHHNGWFTSENVHFSLRSWADLLQSSKLNQWLSVYNLSQNQPKTVALIMAGNIPLVGFHDFLVCLLTGNSVLVKLSSNDRVLLPCLAKILIEVDSNFENRISFTEGHLENFDAVIATGSNNTARYFESYFGKYPHIIRKNRNSIAVLNGSESETQLAALGEDIFRYYGLGCRSVSKLFVPNNYDFDALFKAVYKYHTIINQNKYANNYDYNKAVYLMSEFKILENGFLMLKEDSSYSSPISSVFYEFYENVEQLKSRLSHDDEKIQCIVSDGFVTEEVAFGKTQQPSLADYADGVDTVDFLLKTKLY